MKTRWLAGLLVGLLVFSSAGFVYADASAPGAVAAPRPRGPMIKGEVTAISGDTLTVQTERRDAITVQITGRTIFRAKDDPNFTLADLKVGDVIAVKGRFANDNALVAHVVLLVPADMAGEVRGRVTAIDGGTITVEDKDGKPTNVLTSDETKFRIEGKPEATIADVQVGMLLGAVGQFDANGALMAKHVLAREMPERKLKGGPIGGGEVSSVNGDEFVIKYLDGSSLTVTADASTLVITRGDALRAPALGTLGDVKVGGRILAMGIPSSDGSSLAARVILVGHMRP